MAVTVEQVLVFIGADETDLENVEKATTVLTVSNELITKFVGDSEVPEAILVLATLRLAETIWFQTVIRPGAVEQFYENAATAAPNNRDPFMPAYQLLKNWVSPW